MTTLSHSPLHTLCCGSSGGMVRKTDNSTASAPRIKDRSAPLYVSKMTSSSEASRACEQRNHRRTLQGVFRRIVVLFFCAGYVGATMVQRVGVFPGAFSADYILFFLAATKGDWERVVFLFVLWISVVVGTVAAHFVLGPSNQRCDSRTRSPWRFAIVGVVVCVLLVTADVVAIVAYYDRGVTTEIRWDATLVFAAMATYSEMGFEIVGYGVVTIVTGHTQHVLRGLLDLLRLDSKTHAVHLTATKSRIWQSGTAVASFFLGALSSAGWGAIEAAQRDLDPSDPRRNLRWGLVPAAMLLLISGMLDTRTVDGEMGTRKREGREATDTPSAEIARSLLPLRASSTTTFPSLVSLP